jgi:dihydropyrimidine dehydrogenase (NADP+)
VEVFDGVGEKEGYFTSKDFLPRVSAGSKPGMCSCKSDLPELHGRVGTANLPSPPNNSQPSPG